MEKYKFDHRKLRGEKKKRKLSFGKLADILKEWEPGASKAMVWRWANGGAEPSSSYLILLAKVFEKPMENFFSN